MHLLLRKPLFSTISKPLALRNHSEVLNSPLPFVGAQGSKKLAFCNPPLRRPGCASRWVQRAQPPLAVCTPACKQPAAGSCQGRGSINAAVAVQNKQFHGKLARYPKLNQQIAPKRACGRARLTKKSLGMT